MNKLLLIENDPDDYKAIKKIFSDWDVFPEMHEDIADYSDIDKIMSLIGTKIQDGISAIIVDIALKDEFDDLGIKIIQKIKAINDIRYKTIPIYCYSQYPDKRDDALKKGATNFFKKNEVYGEDNTPEIIFLKQSLTALAFIYNDVCNMSPMLSDFTFISEQLNIILEGQNIMLKAIMQLSSYQDIIDLKDDDEFEQKVKEKIGEETFNKLLQHKWREADNENQEKMIENVIDIISAIPIVSWIGPVLKLIIRFAHIKARALEKCNE
jgi:hypothetical protein